MVLLGSSSPLRILPAEELRVPFRGGFDVGPSSPFDLGLGTKGGVLPSPPTLAENEDEDQEDAKGAAAGCTGSEG